MARKRRSVKRRSHTTVSRPKRRRRMSAGLQGANLKGALFNTAKGAIGGILYTVLAKVVDKDSTKPNNRLGLGLLLSIAAGALLKQPAIGAGIAGAAGITLGQRFAFLNDNGNAEFVPPDTLMSDNIAPDLIPGNDGNYYLPLQDGSFLPLNQYQASAYNEAGTKALVNREQRPLVNMPLNDGSFNRVYPGYLNPGMY